MLTRWERTTRKYWGTGLMKTLLILTAAMAVAVIAGLSLVQSAQVVKMLPVEKPSSSRYTEAAQLSNPDEHDHEPNQPEAAVEAEQEALFMEVDQKQPLAQTQEYTEPLRKLQKKRRGGRFSKPQTPPTRPNISHTGGPPHLVDTGVRLIYHHHISKMGGTTTCRLAIANGESAVGPYCHAPPWVAKNNFANDLHKMLSADSNITVFEIEGTNAGQINALQQKVAGVLYSITLRNPLTWDYSFFQHRNSHRLADAAKANVSCSQRPPKPPPACGQITWQEHDGMTKSDQLVRQLSGMKGSVLQKRSQLDAELLEAAKATLELYDAVLVLEDHQATTSDLEIMHRLAGWNIFDSIASCTRCHYTLNATSDRAAEQPQVLSTEAYLERYLTRAQIERVRGRHKLDLELYEHGRALSRKQRDGSFWAEV